MIPKNLWNIELQLELQKQHGLMWLIHDNEKKLYFVNQINTIVFRPQSSSVNKQILSDIYTIGQALALVMPVPVKNVSNALLLCSTCMLFMKFYN